MGKIKRGKKKDKKPSKVIVDYDYVSKNLPEPEFEVGRIIEVTSKPKDVKGNKLKVDLGFHKIVEPEGNFRNGPMSVHVKDKKGKVVRIGFEYFIPTAKSSKKKK